MNKLEVIEGLRDLQGEHDYEITHYEGDVLLCRFLVSLGHDDVVAEWEKIRKWYS